MEKQNTNTNSANSFPEQFAGELSRLASKHFSKESPGETEIQLITWQVQQVADTLVAVDGLGDVDAFRDALRHVERGIETKNSRHCNSSLASWAKEFLHDCSRNRITEVSVIDAAKWLKERKSYEPKGNNAIGDMLGFGAHCLETKGSGKNKVYLVPNHELFPDFYSNPDDIPARKYYSQSCWEEFITHESAPSASGKKKNSHFLNRIKIQAERKQ